MFHENLRDVLDCPVDEKMQSQGGPSHAGSGHSLAA